MNDKLKSNLSETVAEYSEILKVKREGNKIYPRALKEKICELYKSGVKVSILSQQFKISVGRIYDWIRFSKLNTQSTISTAKRLRLKPKSPQRIENIHSVGPEVPFGRIIFKSGIQMELKCENINSQFLKLLNQLED